MLFQSRGPLIIRRETERVGFFRQTKQKSARVVAPTRRSFVQYDGTKHRDSVHDEYLEVPFRKRKKLKNQRLLKQKQLRVIYVLLHGKLVY